MIWIGSVKYVFHDFIEVLYVSLYSNINLYVETYACGMYIEYGLLPQA